MIKKLHGTPETPHFDTSDLFLAAFLIAKNIPLLSHHSKGHIMVFVFDETSSVDALVQEYYNLNSQVNPQRLAGALKSLKNMLHESRENENKNEYGTHTHFE
jgi:hypothetical protein